MSGDTKKQSSLTRRIASIAVLRVGQTVALLTLILTIICGLIVALALAAATVAFIIFALPFAALLFLGGFMIRLSWKLDPTMCPVTHFTTHPTYKSGRLS